MPGPYDSHNGRKRPYEGTAAGQGSNPNKHPRHGSGIKREDKEQRDECASQTFATVAGNVITDSIPNHVRRHDGQLLQHDNSLTVLLNAHLGNKERFRQYDDQLAKTKESIQQMKTNSNNEKALDETTRANDQVKKEMADLKDAMQARLDAMDIKAGQHNTKVQQTLSAIGKSLQELGSMCQQTVEGDQTAANDAPANDAPANDAQASQQLGNEASGASGTSVKVSADQYFKRLESLDFRRSMDFDRYNNADYQFHEIELLKHEQKKYYLVRQSPQLSSIPSETRIKRFGQQDPIATTEDERVWRDNNILQMSWTHQPADCKSETYVLSLGRVFVDDPQANIPIMWTGFHMVMDIAEPSKPLWLVYCYEGIGHWIEKKPYSWPTTFPDKQKCDVLKFADGVEKARTGPLLPVEVNNTTRYQPFFTKPDYSLLQTAIMDGWKDYKGPTPSSMSLGD
ncbi:hypothetical protein PG995_002864 [Apiospora arundinis]